MSTLRIPVTIQNSLLPSPAMNIWHARADDFGGEEVGGLLDVIEDLDDVQDLYHNAEINP